LEKPLAGGVRGKNVTLCAGDTTMNFSLFE
jgi:hypothetical protein